MATELQRLAPKFDEVVIDTGGRDTTSLRAALAICDTLIVPCVPRSFDVWAMSRVVDLLAEVRLSRADLKAYSFINKGELQGSENEETAAMLRELDGIEYLPAVVTYERPSATPKAGGRLSQS